MEYTAEEKSNRQRKLICGSSLLLTATVAVIVAVAVSKPEASDGDTDANVDPVDPDTGYAIYDHHPMIDVYGAMPDFAALGTKDGTDEGMKTDFWDDKYYGGALYDPFYKWDD